MFEIVVDADAKEISSGLVITKLSEVPPKGQSITPPPSYTNT